MLGLQQKEEIFDRKARGEQYSNQIQRVLLSGNISEADRAVLIDDLQSHEWGLDCLVSYTKTPKIAIDNERLREELRRTDLLVLWVTTDLLNPNNLPTEYNMAKELGVPVLPITTYRETFEYLSGELKSIHGIARKDVDYKISLKAQLEHRLISDELRKEIEEKAFSAHLFLGHRSKPDRQKALKFMKKFHSIENFEAVSIWYDRFLHGGENFEAEIKDVIRNCDGFILLLTPRLVTQKNFVRRVEYPCAKEAGKPIVSVEARPTDLNYFKKLFVGVENPVNLAADELSQRFKAKIVKLAQPWEMTSERAYLLGKAYWNNFYAEKDAKRAIKLFKEAATHDSSTSSLSAAKQLSDAYQHGINTKMSYAKALRWQKKAANICKEIHGKNHRYTATVFNNIADIYFHQAKYSKALQWHNNALTIRERALDKDPLDIATSCNNIAGVYDSLGDYVKALELFKKALAIREDKLGVDHTDTATIYNNIGLAHYRHGEYAKALEEYGKALVIRENKLGKNHLDTSTTYHCIAAVYYVQGRYVDAIELYEKAVVICEKVLGKGHPSTATTYNNIANVYSRQGRYEEALKQYNKALIICEKVLGEDHPDTATTYNNIAYAYYCQGRYEEALKQYNKALDISKKVSGENHSDTAATYNNIALVYSVQGRYEEALKQYNKALIIYEEVLGKEHPHTATTYHNIANVYRSQEWYVDALEWYEKALTIREEVLGIEHPDTADTCGNMAMTYYRQGDDYPKALELFKKALSICEKVVGIEYSKIAAIYNIIKDIYELQGNNSDASEWRKKTLTTKKKEP